MNDDYLRGFREGQASVYELVDKAQRQRDIFGPPVLSAAARGLTLDSLDEKVDRILRDLLLKTDRDISRVMLRYDQLQSRLGLNTLSPSPPAPEPPSVETRLADLEHRANVDWSLPGNMVRNDSLITFAKLGDVKLAAIKRFEELEKRLGDLEEQTALNDRNLDRADAAFVELRKELTQFVAAKVQAVEGRVFNLENPNGDTRWHGVQKRLGDLETKLEDTHANLKVVQAVGERTEGDLDLLSRERAQVNHGLDCAEKRISALEAGPFPPERLRQTDRRLAELENWLGTKKLAPERNFAFETWSRIGKIEARLKTLEPDVPACEE